MVTEINESNYREYIDIPPRGPGFSNIRDHLIHAGDKYFDVVKYIESGLGYGRVRNNRNLLLYENEMDPGVVSYWENYGKGLKKTINNADDQKAKWVSYLPLSALRTKKVSVKYPVIVVIHPASCFIRDSWGFTHLGAEEEVIVVIPQNCDIERIASLLDEIPNSLPVDPNRVYLAGHSMGGLIAQHAGLHSINKVAAIALFGSHIRVSWQPFPNEPSKVQMPVYKDEDVQKFAEYKLPMINANGLCDFGHPFPFHEDYNDASWHWGAHVHTVKDSIDALNFWLTINDGKKVSEADIKITKKRPDQYISERKIGMPFTSSRVDIIDGTPHYFGNVASWDGIVRVAFIAVENAPHEVVPSCPKLAWEFMKHFSRDLTSGASIYNGKKS